MDTHNKSLNFIKHRIASGNCNGMENNNYSSMIESDFVEVFKNIISVPWNNESNSINYKLENVKIDGVEDVGELNVEIHYDPDAEFEYFTMERITCDGTLLYIDLVYKILQKLFKLGTYCATTLPSDFKENPFKYDIKYTVGDFVYASEFGKEFSIPEKPWILERQTVMLPLKCNFIKKEN